MTRTVAEQKKLRGPLAVAGLVEYADFHIRYLIAIEIRRLRKPDDVNPIGVRQCSARNSRLERAVPVPKVRNHREIEPIDNIEADQVNLTARLASVVRQIAAPAFCASGTGFPPTYPPLFCPSSMSTSKGLAVTFV